MPIELQFPVDVGHETTGSMSRPETQAEASIEKPALSGSTESLMELIVDEANIETAWRNVKRNRGAPGPDGETIGEFLEGHADAHCTVVWGGRRETGVLTRFRRCSRTCAATRVTSQNARSIIGATDLLLLPGSLFVPPCRFTEIFNIGERTCNDSIGSRE